MSKPLHRIITSAAAAAAISLMQFSVLPQSAFANDVTENRTISETEMPQSETELTQTPSEATGPTKATSKTTNPTEDSSETTEAATDSPEATDPTETFSEAEETTETTSETDAADPTETSEDATDTSETTDPALPDFSYLGAVGSLSQEQTLMIAERIYSALVNHETKVAFDTEHYEHIQKDRDLTALSQIFYTILYSTRYGILTNQGFSYTYAMPSNRPYYITGMTINYAVPDMMYDDALIDAEQKMDEILANVNPEWSVPEKALYLHDYLCVHFNYDYESIGNATGGDPCFTAYGMLIEHAAVCQGYAWLYNILMNDLGIECYVVTSDENHHAWNVIVLDGVYYHIDCTYDDSSQLSSSQIGLGGQVSHESFMKSHAAMISSGHICNEYDWILSTGRPFWTVDENGEHIVNIPSDNQYSNGFWSTTRTAIYPFRNGWLVKEPDPFNRNAASYNLYTYDFESNTAEWIQQIVGESDPWYAGLDRTRCYSDNYSVCYVKDDILYFTTNSTMMAAIQREGSEQYDYVPVALFPLDDEQANIGFIYGMYISGDTMYYQVAPDLRTAPVEYKCSIKAFSDRIELAAHTLTGDINGDVKLDVIDVLTMSRYLAGVDTFDDIEVRKRADLVEDGVLDIFDFAMLKWLILHQS